MWNPSTAQLGGTPKDQHTAAVFPLSLRWNWSKLFNIYWSNPGIWLISWGGFEPALAWLCCLRSRTNCWWLPASWAGQGTQGDQRTDPFTFSKIPGSLSHLLSLANTWKKMTLIFFIHKECLKKEASFFLCDLASLSAPGPPETQYPWFYGTSPLLRCWDESLAAISGWERLFCFLQPNQ